MGAYRFSMAPNISVPRSRFKMPFNHVTSFNHGKLVPIDCFEILPGDEFKADFSSIIRMSTPIAPIFGNIHAHVHAYFVPMRLVWEHTKEFYGENKTSAGYQQTSYSIPSDAFTGGVALDSISAYLGKPVVTADQEDVTISVLKERGYALIYNEYYRAQQLQDPILITLDDTGSIGTFTTGNSDYAAAGAKSFDFKTKCFNVCKQFDYFTACTLAPQYGAAVTLPLGTTAPVGYIAKTGFTYNDYPVTGPAAPGVSSPNGYNFFALNGTVQAGDFVPLTKRQITSGTIAAESAGSSNLIVADLQNATAASINSIRYAFQVQKWLERANFGSRFFEMLNLHYGVSSPDARLQRPEYLGGFDFNINVDQVISTAGYNAGSTQEVGQTGAVSVTGVRNKNLFHKAFVEPGYVYVLISTTHDRTYAQGILREDSRKDRFDFYFPEFANLGDQSVLSKEIFFADGTLATENNPFGYQEHWAEYRYRPSRASGLMNPTVTGALSYWTLTENFPSRPTLSNSFIMEDRGPLTRALVSGATGPDYIGDFFIDYTAVREMPLYTIPGLVDHFGTM